MKDYLREASIKVGSYAALIMVVAAGYLITFMGAFTEDGYTGTPAETAVSIVLGLIYLGFSLVEERYFARFGSAVGKLFYFGFQLGLVFIINWLIGPGGIWLIALPLAATAVQVLSLISQIGVYLAMLLVIILPIGLRFDNWEAALALGISISPGILFVVVFALAQQREQVARERAEALTAELEAANRQLTEYAAQVEELATIEERNRLAREIHDNLGHYLTVVNVQIGAAKVLLTQKNPDKAMDALDKAQHLTQDGLTAVRQSVAALRESPTGSKPLVEAIAPFIAETNNAGILTELIVQGEPRTLDAKIEFTLYRVVQEGLTNVRRHAHASAAKVLLDYTQPGVVCLQIEDNGVGTAVTKNGFGLLGIQERVNLLSGTVNITAEPREGFTLQITIPA